MDTIHANFRSVSEAITKLAEKIRKLEMRAYDNVVSSSIDYLADVTITSAADQQGLVYDSTSGEWINQNIPIKRGVLVYNDAAFSHNSSGNWLPITFNKEREDTDNFHSVSLNTSRLTCAVSGVYIITGAIEFASNANGIRGIGIRLNGLTYLANHGQYYPVAGTQVLSIARIYKLSASGTPDYVELMAYQDSGGNLNVNSTGNYSPEFGMYLIGAD